jgi:hypothetical protein
MSYDNWIKQNILNILKDKLLRESEIEEYICKRYYELTLKYHDDNYSKLIQKCLISLQEEDRIMGVFIKGENGMEKGFELTENVLNQLKNEYKPDEHYEKEKDILKKIILNMLNKKPYEHSALLCHLYYTDIRSLIPRVDSFYVGFVSQLIDEMIKKGTIQTVTYRGESGDVEEYNDKPCTIDMTLLCTNTFLKEESNKSIEFQKLKNFIKTLTPNEEYHSPNTLRALYANSDITVKEVEECLPILEKEGYVELIKCNTTEYTMLWRKVPLIPDFIKQIKDTALESFYTPMKQILEDTITDGAYREPEFFLYDAEHNPEGIVTNRDNIILLLYQLEKEEYVELIKTPSVFLWRKTIL